MGRGAGHRGRKEAQGGSRPAALVVLISAVFAALLADQPWTPSVVAAAGSLAGLLIGFWGGERLIVR